jgi:hypothetical protein
VWKLRSYFFGGRIAAALWVEGVLAAMCSSLDQFGFRVVGWCKTSLSMRNEVDVCLFFFNVQLMLNLFSNEDELVKE